MKEIVEQMGIFGTEFEIRINSKIVKRVCIERVSMIYKNFHFIFLIDSSGSLIEGVYQFLNIKCKKASINSREQAASALKLLFSFSEIINKDFNDFTENDIQNLTDFLLGLSNTGMNERWSLNTTRSITTLNTYFTTIRNYLSYMGINNEYFFEKHSVSIEKNGFGLLAHKKSIKMEKYNSTLSRHTSFTQFVPKYVSLKEYKSILDLNKKHFKSNELRNRIIIKLMYTRGLRLGEVLGITIEDIKQHPENPKAGLIILRNRVCDKRYQHSKGLLIPTSTEMYKSKLYLEKGKTEITIPPEFMNEIREYIDESRDIFHVSENVFRNISESSIADSVEGNSHNYYLFLNKNGSPLSNTGWGNTLKALFKFAGISIDIGNKRNNLSHKFRHGYAMYLIDVEKKDIHDVKKEMRHKSITSTLIYYNPREEEILEETIKIQKNMLNNLSNITEDNNES